MAFLALICYQSIRVVECPEFRRLCMVLRETLLDSDIPRHDKTREAILYRWKNSFEELKRELMVSLQILPSFYTNLNQWESCGQISFTADVWANGNLAAFLALTAHWISSDKQLGSLSLRAMLIGFHRLKKKHTGRNIARTILYLLDRANVTHKVCYSLTPLGSDVNLHFRSVTLLLTILRTMQWPWMSFNACLPNTR